MSYSALIVDDEPDAVSTALLLLDRYFPDLISPKYTARSVNEATNIIDNHLPEIVFLDINLSGGTGFNVLENVKDADFGIVFMSSHNDYASQAFQASAVHYLKKPYADEDFIEAVHRAINKKEHKHSDKIQKLLESMRADKPVYIPIQTSDVIQYVPLSDVVYFESDMRYCEIYLISGQKKLLSKNLKYYTDLLQYADFFLIERSQLVNMHCVVKLHRHTPSVEMSNGHTLKISRDKKKAFIDALEKLRPLL